MSDIKSEIDSDIEQNYSINSNADPKNMHELTIYVSWTTDCPLGTCSRLNLGIFAGAESPAERSGQIPIYVGPNYLPH